MVIEFLSSAPPITLLSNQPSSTPLCPGPSDRGTLLRNPWKIVLSQRFQRCQIPQTCVCYRGPVGPRVQKLGSPQGLLHFDRWGLLRAFVVKNLKNRRKKPQKTLAVHISGKKKAYTALLQCRTFLCRKKMGSTEERFRWWTWFSWFL